jgi:DNA ligase 1
VEFAVVAQTFADLEDTRSRLALVERLATLLRAVEAPKEVEQICYLVQGRVAPFFVALEMGMADKTVAKAIASAYHAEADQIVALYRERGDLGVVAEQVHLAAKTSAPPLHINEAFARLQAITQIAGKGATDQRIAALAEILVQVDALSAKYVVRIVLGKLRLGVGDATVLDALAVARWNDAKQRKFLEGAYNRTSDLGLIGRTLWEHADAEEARQAVAALSVQVGKPIRAELAERLPTAEAIIAKLGPVLAQYKYDGFRVQIHKAGQEVAIFSRNLENLSHMFPELIAGTLAQVHAENAILDGEALAYQAASEEFLPFQETTRRRRKHQIAQVAEEIPLKAFVFDLLYKDGASLLDVPLSERLEILAQTLQPAEATLMLTRSQVIADAPTLTLLFDEAISKGLEGLVVKRPDSRYEAGARNFNWVKIKRHAAGALDDTIDCVLLGYLVGRGKRTALGAGALLVGVYNAEQDRFETVTKIGTGLSDDQWRSIAERTKGLELNHRPARVWSLIEPSVWVQPTLVIEVLADEITRSPIHTAGKTESEPGYALRFPRLISFREEDKKPEDATTVAELAELYRNQRKKALAPEA